MVEISMTSYYDISSISQQGEIQKSAMHQPDLQTMQGQAFRLGSLRQMRGEPAWQGNRR